MSAATRENLLRIGRERALIYKTLVLTGLRKGGRASITGGRVDLALRHTFGTHLSKAGVTLQTAQAAMRHSDPSLTANVYTDPKLLDVAGAGASLPDLPLAAVGGQAVAAR